MFSQAKGGTAAPTDMSPDTEHRASGTTRLRNLPVRRPPASNRIPFKNRDVKRGSPSYQLP